MKDSILDNLLQGYGSKVKVNNEPELTEGSEGSYTNDGGDDGDGIRIMGIKPYKLAIGAVLGIAAIIITVKLVKHYKK